MGECSVQDCSKESAKKGFCGAHYKRWYRYGDPLVTKKIPNGEAVRFFESDVLSYEGGDCFPWPYAKYPSGYGHLSYEGRDVTVSRLVCEKVHGPAPSREHHAAHSCGKGHEGCVNKRHLRWATPKENSADKKGHGTSLRGEKAPWSKIKEQDAVQIISLRDKMLQREIAELFGITRTTVGLIQRGKLWSHIGEKNYG